MTKQISGKLNWLERNLPEGLLVDAAWLSRHGFSTALRSQYVSGHWLHQPVRGVYQRPRGTLTWQQAVISLQTLLELPVVVGGRSALELQGYAHFLPQKTKEVHLYGPQRPPNWLFKLPLNVSFRWRNDAKLFDEHQAIRKLPDLNWHKEKSSRTDTDAIEGGLTVQSWGQWDWPFTLSTPERAVLELLDELPTHESFHQVDKLMEGMANLSPRRLQSLLANCRNVKVKRLFFYFADRHHHAWLKRLNKTSIDLGKGKRMLVKGGKLDHTYQITVPEDLNGVR